MPNTVGSYWVYQWVKIDAMGVEKLMMPVKDSIYIIGNTVINALTCTDYKGTWMNNPTS